MVYNLIEPEQIKTENRSKVTVAFCPAQLIKNGENVLYTKILL